MTGGSMSIDIELLKWGKGEGW